MIADSEIDGARTIRIEGEIVRRGIELKRAGAELIGPCPKCGGSDRFASWVRSRNIAWAKAQQKAGAAA